MSISTSVDTKYKSDESSKYQWRIIYQMFWEETYLEFPPLEGEVNMDASFYQLIRRSNFIGLLQD